MKLPSGLIKKLLENKIKCNVTAIFTMTAGKRCYMKFWTILKQMLILSIFAGRIADTGIDPIPMMSEAVKYVKQKKYLKFYGQALEN